MEKKETNRARSKLTWEKQKALGFQNYTLRERPEFILKIKEFVNKLKMENKK